MSTDLTKKSPLKPTPARYASVKDLMQGEQMGAEVQKAYAELEGATRITDQLAHLRRSAGLTQEDMGKRLGITQAAISKIEAGRDETLTLEIIRAYSAATGRRIGLSFGKPMSRAESVTAHTLEIQQHLAALTALTRQDDIPAKSPKGKKIEVRMHA